MGACRLDMSQGTQLRRRGCAIVWTSREVTVAVTIYDKMSKSRWKGVGGEQLRDEVWARSRMICRRINVTVAEKEGMIECEFQNTYKLEGGIHWTLCSFERSKLLCISTGMDLPNINAKRVSPGVGMSLMVMQDFLDSVVSMAADCT